MSLALVRSRTLALAVSAALIGFLSSGCAAAQSPSPATATAPDLRASSPKISPPFYRVHGHGGARLDILGTIHLGPASGWDFPSDVDDALLNAAAFVLEIDLRALAAGEVGDLLAELVILPVGTTLDQVVSPETAKLLEIQEASLAAIGFPRNARRHKKPWYLVMSIVTLDSQKSGFDPTQSVETAILAAAGPRPLLALETFESQLKLMDGLSPGIQDILLRDTLMRREESTKDIQHLVEAWAQNDQKALAAIAYQGVDEHPELVDFYDALLKERNRRWVTKLRGLLDDPKRSGESIFVGVGALHLVGSDNLIQLLREAGYDVDTVHRPSSR